MCEDYDEEKAEAEINAYHEGWDAYRKGVPDSLDRLKPWRDGWRDAKNARRVKVVMPKREEGYYHQSLNGDV